ncbi:hypothetical protein LAZ67_11002975 [Cordylochernes scorpioides]|uniref:Reverse transcriptase domain-containing protein n=1 Tax=Cordylochernes scorpioides TaxID=51811 RepID=A0ABY6KZJ8_9ARAC|nr:hypothetical protein LAZ67_11002975 [Cordylochernes scorpioides]
MNRSDLLHGQDTTSVGQYCDQGVWTDLLHGQDTTTTSVGRYCDQGVWTDLIFSMDKTPLLPQLAGIVIRDSILIHGCRESTVYIARPLTSLIQITGGLGGLYNPTDLQLPLVSERKARDLIISPLAEGLLEFLEDNSLTIINGRSTGDREGDFTYVSERGSSTIDYCIVSQGILEKISDFRIETQMYSDNLPLILKITAQNTYENKSKVEEYGVTRYRWTAEAIKTFNQELKELQVIKISNLDSSVNTFTQRITEAMSTSGIISKPWFDKNCYEMKKLTKESLKEYRRTNRKEDLESYALHRKKYLGLLDDKRKKYIQEKQEILRYIKDSKSFWKTIALFKRATKIQGKITVQEWHEFYCELMKKEKICNIEVRISPSDSILDPEITSEEIGRAIRDLKNNKASGPDDIPNEIIKVLPDSYMGLLEQFYNRALIMGHYPTIWTKSIIHPIFKSGDKDNPSNYRGIALISNLSKLFTTILRSRLNEWVERRNVIPENQAGFRRGRSCVDLIFTLTTLIQLSLRKKRGKLYVFIVDLRKAFDTVPHSLLWKKLTNLDVSYQFIHAIRNTTNRRLWQSDGGDQLQKILRHIRAFYKESHYRHYFLYYS